MASSDPKALRAAERYFAAGMDSYSLPDALNPGEYQFGLNTVCRGGIVQTRPGTRSLSCLPDGRLQGFTRKPYYPRVGEAWLAAAVDGVVYVSRQPFDTWTVLSGIKFSKNSRFVTFEIAVKSTSYTDAGELYYLYKEKRVLMMQDGATRAAYWDGSTAAHIDPTESGLEATPPDKDGTPIGLHMCWSGSRLWVSRGSRVYACDIGNPLKATERQYLNESPAFYLPSTCMGMVDMAEKGGMLVLHEEGADFIETSILDRTQWSSTPNMQQTVASVGCISHRSVIRQHGMIYWFSPAGLINLNEALRANTTSELVPLDQPMAWSKAYIGPDLSTIASAAFENYLLVSVPFCSPYNAHTWAMDLAVFEGNAKAWNSVWTGWNPVEWCTGKVNGRQRAFFVSRDVDGHNRLWEAFTDDRRDNGCAITCSAQFRLHPVQGADRKKFGWANIDMAQLYGDVSVMAAIASSRGWFEKIMEKEVVATDGRVNADDTYGDGTTYPELGSNRPQVRRLITRRWTDPQDYNVTGVEGSEIHNLDEYFQLFVAWSGRAGVEGYRLHATDDANDMPGNGEDDETGYHHLGTDGRSAVTEFVTGAKPFATYTASATASGSGLNGHSTISVQSTASCQISQAAATRMAECRANGQLSAISLLTDDELDGDISATTRQHVISVQKIHTWITYLTQ